MSGPGESRRHSQPATTFHGGLWFGTSFGLFSKYLILSLGEAPVVGSPKLKFLVFKLKAI